MASLRKRGKVWYFRFVDSDGTKQSIKGCTDRRATEEMARAAETNAAKMRAGLIDVKAEAFRDHAARPLSDHLDDFQAAGTSKGLTMKHVKGFANLARVVTALASGAPLATIDAPNRSTVAERADFHETMRQRLANARLSDLTPSRIQGALATLKASGRSLSTVNAHRTAVKAFCSWAVADGRTRDDPTASVTGFNAKEDRRHDRRTLSLDELRRLVSAAEVGPTYRHMTGSARALCYRLAVSTGLRYSEIKSVWIP